MKRPARFILENVPNILRHDGGLTKETIIKDLERLGYHVKVEHFSPHEFGIPQVRDRAYFIGSLDGLQNFEWPVKHKERTDITSVLRNDAPITRPIPHMTIRAIDMWGDFLSRTPPLLKMPSFPIWAMEFGATYPYEDETPAGVWKRRPIRGFSGMHVKGSFGFDLDGREISRQKELVPSHARRDGDFDFPPWKRTFIRQNRSFFHQNRVWIEPWLNEWRPWDFPSSFQKLEWNAQGETRDIDHFVLQVRASGIRVKRPTTAPSLIAFTQTQVPILGAHLAGQRRYMTPRECAELQSLGAIEFPANELDAYKALGNAVNAQVAKAIARPLLAGVQVPVLLHTTAITHMNQLEPLGAIA